MSNDKDIYDEITLGSLQQWIANRAGETMPDEYAIYLEMLEKTYGWHHSMACEKEIIDNLITHYPHHFQGNRSKAKKIYTDARNHFYIDDDVLPEATALIYADKLDRLALMMLETSKDVSDLAKIKDVWKEAATLRGAYAEKKEQLPPEVYEQRYMLFTNKITDLGLPELPVAEIKSIIHGLPLPAEEILRLEQEADISEGVKQIFDWDEQEEENK